MPTVRFFGVFCLFVKWYGMRREGFDFAGGLLVVLKDQISKNAFPGG